MSLILASASPRRMELLLYITENFIAFPAKVEENIPDDIPVLSASEYLSEIKANAVFEKFPDDVIIGCDTTVVCEDKILGKPENFNQCIEYMHMLSGKTHQVVTGCTIVSKEKKLSFSVVTDVTFRNLSGEEIINYASTKEPYDKAGGYGIQGKGCLLVEKINGDYFNVVGLPVSRLCQELKKFNI